MRARSRPDLRACAFSLVELLVVLAVSGILFTALATFARTSLNATAVAQDRNAADQTARVALFRLMREASLAKSITTALSNRLAFTCTDITGDDADDSVDYSWDSGSHVLTRTLNGTSETFGENITQFSLEYQYETEQQTAIASGSDSLSVTIGSFDGTVQEGSHEGDASFGLNYELDLDDKVLVRQYFTALVEVDSVPSVIIRARTKQLPPEINAYVFLHDDNDQLLADGWLDGSQLTTEFQDVVVPLTWKAGGDTKIEVGKRYHLHLRPGGYYGSNDYAGTIRYHVGVFRTLGNGLEFSYNWSYLGDKTSMYFQALGAVAFSTPTRTTTPVSVLKKITATVRVTEGGQEAELSRTCKVLNQ